MNVFYLANWRLANVEEFTSPKYTLNRVRFKDHLCLLRNLDQRHHKVEWRELKIFFSDLKKITVAKKDNRMNKIQGLYICTSTN